MARHLALRNTLLRVSVWISGLLLMFFFISFFCDLSMSVKDWSQVWSVSFFTSDVENAGRAGGIRPVLVSTALLLLIGVIGAFPVSLGAAIWLDEARRVESRSVELITSQIRLMLEILAAVPSVVLGLFGAAFFSDFLGLGYSLLSGGLTLSCMLIPIMTLFMDHALRSVPQETHAACLALALSRGTIFFKVLLPLILPSLGAAILLGVGRAAAETTALLFTSGMVDRMPESLMDSGRSLSVHIYELAMNVPGGQVNAFRSVLVLTVFLFCFNGLLRKWLFSRSVIGRAA